MSRIRSIKPDYWSSEQVMALPRDARLLFIGLWNFADDEGRFKWAPRTIKAQVLPGDDDITSADVERWLSLLVHVGLIERYVSPHGGFSESSVSAHGIEFGVITGWHHQKVNRPAPSKLPNPKDSVRVHGGFSESSVNDHGGLRADPLGSSGIQLGSAEGERVADAPSEPAAPASLPPAGGEAEKRERVAGAPRELLPSLPLGERRPELAAKRQPAAQKALEGALKRAMGVPPQLSRSLREKAAKRLTDAVAAGVAPDLDSAGDILVGAWRERAPDNTWKLLDVPIKTASERRPQEAKALTW